MRMRRKEWMSRELEESAFYLENATRFRGAWGDVFPQKRPLWLELGVGKGSFIAQMGVLHPEINFLGIDITTAILASAHRSVKRICGTSSPENIRLVAWDVSRLAELMEPEDTAERIYINFCNPWPKDRHKKRRLTHPKQLALYKTVLAKGGEIRIKTDDAELFTDTVSYLEEDPDWVILEKEEDLSRRPDIESPVTEHQIMFTEMGIPTKYVSAKYVPAEKNGETY